MVLQKSLKKRNDLKFRNDLWCNDLWVSTVYKLKLILGKTLKFGKNLNSGLRFRPNESYFFYFRNSD